jgi:hypothetical protein
LYFDQANPLKRFECLADAQLGFDAVTRFSRSMTLRVRGSSLVYYLVKPGISAALKAAEPRFQARKSTKTVEGRYADDEIKLNVSH